MEVEGQLEGTRVLRSLVLSFGKQSPPPPGCSPLDKAFFITVPAEPELGPRDTKPVLLSTHGAGVLECSTTSSEQSFPQKEPFWAESGFTALSIHTDPGWWQNEQRGLRSMACQGSPRVRVRRTVRQTHAHPNLG